MEYVEKRLEPLDTWPTCIIGYLFVDLPSPPIVRKLSAFFYGNNVSLYTAHNCTWSVITRVIFMQLIICINYVLIDNDECMDFICFIIMC